MRATWRWFGPQDTVPVDWMMQAGVEGVVSALHHVPYGAAWTPDEIAKRQAEIATMRDGGPSGLAWEVVESLPVSEDVKTQTGDWRAHLDAYRSSLEALAAAGIRVVCYNFMPVLDWTRTDLAWRLPHGGTAMRFDAVDFAAFDIHILGRPGAADGLPEDVVEAAGRRHAAMDDPAKERLAANLVMGLPGGQAGLTLDELCDHLATYAAIPEDRLRRHLADFLAEVVPTAERLGLRMCCHPDDPPWPLLGLPRIASTEADYVSLTAAVDSPANGVTLCSGALGPRTDNDLPGMMRRLGRKVHFLHLRNVAREGDAVTGGSFHEADHLAGATDMAALVAAVLAEEDRRNAEGRADAEIPFRPDHGQDLMDDAARGGQPGYPAVGRLKGLAELRGVVAGLRHGAGR
ncbi:mannonate dehydratase [Jannaschia sp. LMIT008]|uniref:mannonate dehydratase n=1 Tax=Jannaschia maritima TaxID=3032585 RepID=UPI00281185DF|nr:mannonate dehydratase [Jannaschia sp. LMIT008]